MCIYYISMSDLLDSLLSLIFKIGGVFFKFLLVRIVMVFIIFYGCLCSWFIYMIRRKLYGGLIFMRF